MMASNLSPEERLFKVIQQQKESPSSASLPSGRFFANLRQGRWAVLLPKFERLNIDLVNRVLLVALLLLLVAFLYVAVAHRPNLAKIIKSAAHRQNMDAGDSVKARDWMPLSFYIDQSRSRNMFMPAPANAAEAPALPPVAVASGKLKEMTGDLKLMGIARGKYPKAVIKDEKENKIYFLEENQQVGSTGIEVKKILEHKVIVKIGDQNEELV